MEGSGKDFAPPRPHPIPETEGDMNTKKCGLIAMRRLLPALALTTLLATASGAAPTRTLDQFPAFIPMPGVTAEGVAVDKAGNVYLSVREGDLGVVWKLTPQGDATRFAEIPSGMIGGVAVAANEDLYVAVAIGAGRGVYRLNRIGQAERLAGTEQIVFANALAFDTRGTLYVTESFSMVSAGEYGPGGVWRITPGGVAEPWLRHPLLTGTGAALGYPVGANGIAFYHGDLFIVNTDLGLLVRVPVTTDGSPGQPAVWVQLHEVAGSPLAGNPIPALGDGLALDVHGNVYVAVVSRCAVVRIDAEDRSQETVAAFRFGAPGPPQSVPLDTPASLAFGTGAGEQMQLFVTSLGMMSAIAPGPPWPGSGLVKIDAGVPGRPGR